MKAITVKQPWASLIVHGIKDIENRTWPCPKRYIGKRVLIHASSSPVKMVNPNNIFSKQQWDSLSMGLQREIICGYNEPTSAIIGSVEIVDCVQNHPSICRLLQGLEWQLWSTGRSLSFIFFLSSPLASQFSQPCAIPVPHPVPSSR